MVRISFRNLEIFLQMIFRWLSVLLLHAVVKWAIWQVDELCRPRFDTPFESLVAGCLPALESYNYEYIALASFLKKIMLGHTRARTLVSRFSTITDIETGLYATPTSLTKYAEVASLALMMGQTFKGYLEPFTGCARHTNAISNG